MQGEPRPLTDAERLDWLRLWRSENVGPATFAALLRLTGSAGAAIERLPDLARRGGLKRTVAIADGAAIRAEADRLDSLGGRLIALCEPDYPAPLAAIPDPPPVIACRGRADLLARDAVAIVGARNASGLGRRFARGLAAETGAAGLVVVSGLARGIDTEAHTGALDTGTVAVLAGGIDVVYPPENEALYARIVEAGAVVSEQPLGMAPQARHFPRRNRIVSGLALAVVVVEAGLRSGSLITARLAGEQGREVLAVPGSPLDPRHKGTNWLIRDGAGMVEGPQDIVEAVQSMRRPHFAEPGPRGAPGPESAHSGKDLDIGDRDRSQVLDALGPSPVGVDELVRQCHLTAASVMMIVLELELAGRLTRHPGGTVSLSPDESPGDFFSHT